MEDSAKTNEARRKLNDAIHSFIWGVLVLALALWLWSSLTKEPFNELALIRKAQLTEGAIYDAAYGLGEHENLWRADYSFSLPNGNKKFSGSSVFSEDLLKDLSEDKLPYKVIIEYLPSNPSVNRIQGSGLRSISAWAKYNAGLALFLLSAFAFSSYLLFIGGRGVWKYPFNPIQPFILTTAKFLLGAAVLVALSALAYSLTRIYIWFGAQGDEAGYWALTMLGLFVLLPYPVVLLVDKINAKRQKSSNTAPNNSFNRSAS